MDVVEGLPRRLQRQEIRHLPVHAGGPQRAPEGDDEGPAVVQAQLALGRLFGELEEVLPHRRAGDDDLVRVAVKGPAGLKAHHDPVCVGFQHPGGEAGDHIGLVDRRGDPGLGRRLHHRVAGVAAGTDDGPGLKFLQNGPGLVRGPHQIGRGNEVMPDLRRTHGAVEAGNMDRLKGVTCLGHQVLFQAPLRSHEQKLCLRIPLPQKLGQGDGGVHMPRRAAAGKDPAVWISLQCCHVSRSFPGAIRPWWAASAATPTARCPFPPAAWKGPCRRS